MTKTDTLPLCTRAAGLLHRIQVVSPDRLDRKFAGAVPLNRPNAGLRILKIRVNDPSTYINLYPTERHQHPCPGPVKQSDVKEVPWRQPLDGTRRKTGQYYVTNFGIGSRIFQWHDVP